MIFRACIMISRICIIKNVESLFLCNWKALSPGHQGKKKTICYVLFFFFFSRHKLFWFHCKELQAPKVACNSITYANEFGYFISQSYILEVLLGYDDKIHGS